MPKAQNTQIRREFLRNGLRAVALGGLAFVGFSLGWRGYSSAAPEASCPIDAPCRSCAEQPTCRKPKALASRPVPHESRYQEKTQVRGVK